MTADQLARFPAACHKYGPNVRMTLWTTARGISPQAERAFGSSVSVFGYKQICEFLDGDEYFLGESLCQQFGSHSQAQDRPT